MSLRAVATSVQSETQAGALGIPLVELPRTGVDLAVDGADSVDPSLRLIKGLGGALVREKIVAAAARTFVVVVDAGKLHHRLRGPVPVEVIPFGSLATLAALESTGAAFDLRRGPDGSPALSDNGNLIADGAFTALDDPEGGEGTASSSAWRTWSSPATPTAPSNASPPRSRVLAAAGG
jgi:ribose 5-phosphate isomerase A